jgi:NAD(P)-dependent dehydrogenase (short-subunit alcohol dehydrogenase family)
MTGRVAGRTALVIGGGGNIGGATAAALAREGAQVVVTGRDAEKGTARAKSIQDTGGNARFVSHEVTDRDAWPALFTDVRDHEGGPDIVVCSAGKAFLAAFERSTVQDLTDALAVNVEGVFLAAKEAFGAWRATGKGGNFIAISGVNGLRGAPNASVHSATKGGMTGLVRGLAEEGRTIGVSANTIHPSLTWPGGQPPAKAVEIFGADRLAGHMANTRAITPMGRIGEPEDIAEAILLLAEQTRPVITGQQIAVDGGRTAGEFRRKTAS